MITKGRFNKEIKDIVDQLKRLYNPDKIILFGSLVNGKLKEGTDIDLFIIKDDIPRLGVDRIRQLESIVQYSLATDFIVYKSKEVGKRLKLGDPFIKSIIEDGKILYEAE